MTDSTPLSYNPPSGPCAVCGEEGRPCARCRLHYYCGKVHQRQHWAKHRAGCGVLELREGRVLAAKDIPAGTVVMREIPRLTIPPILPKDQPIELCFGCYGTLPQGSRCRHCGLPFCGTACGQDEVHAPECAAFRRAKYRLSKAEFKKRTYNFIGVAVGALRTALLAQSEPRIKTLQCTLNPDADSCKALPNVRKMVVDEEEPGRIVQWLRLTVGVTWISEEELLHATTVNHIYSECVFDRNMKGCRGILVGSGRLEPTCLPNTAQLPLDDRPGLREHITVASKDIAAGEELLMTRGDSWFEPTRTRRALQLASRGSMCRCARCRDPTEMGLYVGSPCCPACAEAGKQSYVIAASEDLLEWQCETCGRAMSASDVDALTRAALEQLEELSNGPVASVRAFSEFVNKQVFPTGPLHETHSLVFSALENMRFSIFDHAILTISQAEARLGIEACRRLVRGLDRLLPGVSDYRVVVLMSLRRLLLFTLSSLVTNSKPFDGDLDALKREILAVTQEVVRLIYSRDDVEPKYSLINFPFVYG